MELTHPGSWTCSVVSSVADRWSTLPPLDGISATKPTTESTGGTRIRRQRRSVFVGRAESHDLEGLSNVRGFE